MPIEQLSELKKEDLLKRLVSKTQNMEEPQGADFNLFRGFEAWATLRSLTASGANPQGILGTALLSGNAHILIISLGKLIDPRKDQKNSLKKLWTEYSYAIPDSDEKKLIDHYLHHPDKPGHLKHLHFLRHNIFAHNRQTRISIDNEPIEEALHFCFRTWYLLSQLIPENFLLCPFKHFSNENWNLNSILNSKEYDLFESAWKACNAKGERWINTPLLP